MAGEHKACDIAYTADAAAFIIRVKHSPTATNDLPSGRYDESSTVVGSRGGYVCEAHCVESYDGSKIKLVILIRNGSRRPAPPGETSTKRISISIVLLDKTGSPTSTAKGEDVPPCKDWAGGGYALVASKDDVEANCVVDGYFAALCSVAIVEDWPPPLSSLIDIPGLGSDLAEMKSNKDLTDVSIDVDGETFCAHRLVLAARSPVFKAELYGPMAESKMASITVKDIKASTFRYMLHYMYHGALTYFDDEADDAATSAEYQHLLVAADIYAVEMLKQTCESRLCEGGITVDTVCSMLELAEEHTCPKLKAKCLDFLVDDQNFKTVATSDDYLHLMQNFPSLLVQVRNRLRLS